MSYRATLGEIGRDPEQLEVAYRRAAVAGEEAAFTAAIDDAHAAQPDDVLYAAWHYRFVYALAEQVPARSVAWAAAVVLALLNGAVLFFLADQNVEFARDVPAFIILWAPISAAFVMLFLTWASAREWSRFVIAAAFLTAVSLFAYIAVPWLKDYARQEHYLILVAMHLPILAWAAVGWFVMGGARHSNENRAAFVLKSLEVFVGGGLYLIAGGVFVAVTVALFDVLAIELSDTIMFLLVVGGAGLLPVLAVATAYDPAQPPVAQPFEDGLGKLIALLMRLLLPLTLAVLVINLFFIPFNFWEPFENRDVLITYTAMLFAVLALLVGATPAPGSSHSPSMLRWLRWGVGLTALAAGLVGIYALAAIGTRTFEGGWSPNRVAFVGWDVIDIVLLGLLALASVRGDKRAWLAAVRRAIGGGAVAYALWALVVVVTLSFIFGVPDVPTFLR